MTHKAADVLALLAPHALGRGKVNVDNDLFSTFIQVGIVRRV